MAESNPTARASVSHRPDAVRLDHKLYPLLVYLGPGRGVCTEDNQTPVRQIADASGPVADVASRFGTTATHVGQALAYIAAHPDEV